MSITRIVLAALAMSGFILNAAENPSKDPADAAGWLRKIQRLAEKDLIAESMDELRVAFNSAQLKNDGTLESAAKELDAAITKARDEKQKERAAALLVVRAGVVIATHGDLKAAEKLLTDAEELDPKLPEVFNTRGVCRLSANNLDGALEDFNAALKLNPNYLDAYSNRAHCKAKMGDEAGATRDMVDFLRLMNRASRPQK